MNAVGQAVLGLGLVLLCGAVSAEESAREMPASTVDISSPTLLKALIALQQQTGLQFICPTDGTGETPVPAVAGVYTPKAAVQKLLAGSGLKYEFINERTVAIASNKTANAKSLKISALTSSSASYTPLPESDVQTEQGSYRVAEREEEPEEEAKASKLDEVVVTGSHIRGSESVGSKVIVLDRDYIEKSGYGTIQDVLKTLPQNATGPGEDLQDGGNLDPRRIFGNIGYGVGINLRGLGTGATLVLINGVRQAPAGLSGGFFDVSNIPVSAVERIEILPDGASAIYGSDAIGGVVNIILRTDFRGLETQVRLATMDGDADETRISQLFGSTWSGGRVTAGFEYYKREALPYTARPYAADSDQTRNGGDNFDTFFTNPGNVLCPVGRPDLDCAPFQPTYGIPAGQDGTALTPGDIQSQLAHSENANRGLSLIPDVNRSGGFFEIAQKVGNRLELVAGGHYGTRPNEWNNTARQYTLLLVPDTNAFFVDPFGGSESLRVAYNFKDDLQSIQTGRSESYDGTLDAIFTLNRDWQLRFKNSYSLSRSRRVNNGTDSDALTLALADSNADTAFNPFGDGANTNPATIASIRLKGLEHARSTTWSHGISADGPLFRIPGGRIKLAGGLDYRRETQTTQRSAEPEVDGLSRHDMAAYAELVVPLFGPDNERPGFHRLEVSLAGRREEYNDWGSAILPKLGLRWAPSRSLSLRGTWGESFKAPLLIDSENSVIYPNVLGAAFVEDPLTPDGALILTLDGANSGLREERGEERTLGLDFTPQRWQGFTAALTYYDNEYKDRIGIGGTPGREDFILLEEDLWSAIIHRNPTPAEVEEVCNLAVGFTPSDCASIATIPITAFVDYRLRNIHLTKTSGFDLDLKQALETSRGLFEFGVNGTFVIDNEFALAETTPAADLLDKVGNPLSLRLQARGSWSYRGFGSNFVVDYVPAYDDPLSGLAGTPRGVGSWSTVNWGMSYRTSQGDGWLNNAVLRVNVVNVFDEDPPFVNSPIGYDPANADPYGRLVSLEMVKAW